MAIRPTFTQFAPEDEHLARRLAAAVLVQWNSIPNDLRHVIVEQAGLVEDTGSETVQLREQINAFIRQYAPSIER